MSNLDNLKMQLEIAKENKRQSNSETYQRQIDELIMLIGSEENDFKK